MKTETQPVEQEEFLKHYAASQRQIFAFVVSLAPGWTDADDIFQAVSLVLWRKWHDYDRERSFIAWAFGIARIEVRKQMELRGRANRMLSEEAVVAIESRMEETHEVMDPRLDALQACLERLPAKHRSLVTQCYSGTDTIKEVAAAHNLSSDAVYGRLKRIRELLHQCIDRSISTEEGVCRG